MKNAIILFIYIVSINIYSQVQINSSGNFNDPSYLIDNVLIGNGVTTSNHSYIGDSSQISYFTDSLGNIGFTEGFILTTGRVDSIGNTGVDTLPWWNYIYDSLWNIIDSTPVIEGTFLSTSFFNNGDNDLLTIANSVPGLIGQSFSVSNTQDAAILEFDFIPSSDTVEFNYVFASEEYLDFVNSDFNDVFAFLISGPGITGPYASPPSFPGGAMNIAVVPNSNPILPITISTVNDTLNSQYYNHDSLSIASAFNGYTSVFTARASVTPCNVYHIKLAIADGTDDSYDSGVFFEAGSFDATEPGALNVNAITTDLQCYGDSNGAAQLCISGGVAPYITNWNGQNPNSLAAGTYYVDVTDAQGSSGGTTYTINSPSQLIITASQNGMQLEGIVNGGTPGYLYDWTLNGISVNNTAFFTPSQNGTYVLNITDANGCTAISDPINVNNIPSSLYHLSYQELSIIPNPISTFGEINLIGNEKVKNISIFDISSRMVKNINYSIFSDKILINKGRLNNGIYMLTIITDQYVSKIKLIIE